MGSVLPEDSCALSPGSCPAGSASESVSQVWGWEVKAIYHRNAGTIFGTFGYLDLFAVDGTKLGRFCIAEDDWLDNKPTKSCIPDGQYVCRSTVSPKFGQTYEITKVPNRSHILFHAGNTEEDTMGCLLVGNSFGGLVVPDEDNPAHPKVAKWAVVDSKKAFARFLDLLDGVPSFPLEIRWDFHGWR